MTSINNRFNGYYLEYNISIALFNQIRNIIHKDSFNVFNSLGVEVMAQPNMFAIIPIGIFSNKDFKLNCKEWTLTDRRYAIPMKNTIKSIIELTLVQSKIIEVFFENCNDIEKNNLSPVYINLVGECSIGKTVMAIHIISLFKYKTLIITPSIDLAKQWGTSIKRFLENSDYHVSTLGANILLKNLKDVPDILLCPSKHLANQEFIKYIMQNYTICIIDEQHVYNLETNKMMKKFFAFNSFPFVFSLTATPRSFNALYLGREINLEKIVEEYKPSTFIKDSYEVVIPKYELIKYCDHFDKYKEICKKQRLSKDEILYKSILKKRCLSEDPNRNKAIIKNIKQTFFNNCDSKILVLVHFVSEIDNIYNEIINKQQNKIVFNSIDSAQENSDQKIIRGNYGKTRDNSNFIEPSIVFKVYASSRNNEPTSLISVKEQIIEKEKYIIIGTEDHLGTGIDVKELNILHLTSISTNKNNIIQYAGRVSRDNPTKVHQLFYYNISSYPNIKLDQNCHDIQKILKNKGWNIEKKMLF
mgnify:CR=1 FL=1